ncbi:hypothetical protein H6P81_020923 [Aristolochia fimbriata]|uniref:Pentatricopeptide repeat-containing protein n=1 Tax=Aristolochia fimbriata TaxID=158543 RepID=A0AAV7DWR1_ARIFI|nr:hypothetical protein H6P81_020923 [Aristolochia fimbriata]
MEAVRLVKLVQKCVSSKSLRKARQFHALLVTSTPVFDSLPFLGNNVLSMYAKLGSMDEARQVFDQMPQRNPVSYNALIAGYSRNACHAFLSFELLSAMAVENLRPNGSTFTSLLQACAYLEDEAEGAKLHGQVEKVGFSSDVRVQTSLFGMYSACENLDCANRVFDEMEEKDDVAWNSIIYGNVKHGRIEESLHIFCSMMRTGKVPTQFTFSIVLNACARLKDHFGGKIIHGQIVKSNISVDVPLQNSLLNLYSSSGDMETAFSVFKMIEKPDLVSWNSIMAGCSENGCVEEAMNLFVQLLDASTERPDQYTFAAVVSATGPLPAVNYGKPLHAQVAKAGFGGNIFVCSTLVGMYFRNEEMESARKLFDSVSGKDIILWTEMISGYLKLGEAETAINYFCEMQKQHKADSFALSSALSGAADLAALKQGEVIHCLAIKSGHNSDMCVSGSLVDMYSKNGSLEAANIIFSEVRNPDLKCWNSMLGGFCHHGKAEQAFQLFNHMLERGLKPDHVTFISLLSACSHCGLVGRGNFYWNYMRYMGLEPGVKHYSCMVSLLSRAGLLQEAEDLISSSGLGSKFPELWRNLLCSCVIHKELDLGERAAERVLFLLPEDSATHIMLSNLYAAAGRWDAVSDMRRKIRGLLTEKDPGLSWIQVFDQTLVFYAGYEPHLILDEAQAELQRLRGNLEECAVTEVLECL